MPYLEVTQQEDKTRGLIDFDFSLLKNNVPFLVFFTNSPQIASEISHNLKGAKIRHLQGSQNLYYSVNDEITDRAVRITGNIYNAIDQLLKLKLISKNLYDSFYSNKEIASILNQSKAFDEELDFIIDDEQIKDIEKIMNNEEEIKASESTNQRDTEQEMLLHIQNMDPTLRKEFLTKLANSLKPYGYEITIKDTSTLTKQPTSPKVF
jgi:hypothetical protein